MKIALLAARLPPANDGVGDHASILARTLAAGGHDVTVVTAGHADPATGFAIETAGKTWNASASMRAIDVLRARRVDAVIVEYTPFFFGAASFAPLAVLLAARGLGIRSAIMVHEAFYKGGTHAVRSTWKAKLFAARDAATIAAADTIAVPGAARGAAVGSRLPFVKDRIVVAPIGANIEPPAGYRRSEERGRTIVSFGLVMPRRRLELGIRAVAQLVAAGADVRFDIIGRVPDADYAATLSRFAGEIGVAERVRLLGELRGDEITGALGSADAAIHAVEEGSVPSSGSLLALLAHGVPTVALRTAYDDGVFAGAIRFAENESGLTAALRETIDEPRAARELGAAATRCYAQNFVWSIGAGRIVRALAPQTRK